MPYFARNDSLKMETAKLQLTKIWKDEVENFYQMVVSASNGRFTATVEDYFVPEEIASFAQQLLNFPQHLDHEVVFEWGKDHDDSDSYLRLRAYVYDQLGHVALEIRMRTNGIAPWTSSACFAIATEAASLNKLGETLSRWARSDEIEYVHEFYLRI
ncbi:MAG: hypothetical protein U0175_21255 [Caldilineaceae bacterium]